MNPAASEEALRALLRGRRTVHEFQPELPPWENVLPALETARLAPNHFFTHPWRFYRIGPATKTAIVELNADLVRAGKGDAAAEKKRQRWDQVPGWLVITSRKSADARRTQEDYAACCCAVQNLMLDLWAQGIASKWTTGAVTRLPEFYRLLGTKPQLETVVSLLWYGYPATVPAARRRPLAESLVYLP